MHHNGAHSPGTLALAPAVVRPAPRSTAAPDTGRVSPHRAVAWISAVLLAAAVLSGCGNGTGDTGAGSSTGPSGTAAPTTTPTGAPGSTSAPHEDDVEHAPPFPANTDPDTGQASAGASLTVTDVRTGHQDGFDRVVFELGGTGTPGWNVRYVDRAVSQGKGDTLPVAGNAILQVTISGVGYPTETGIPEYDGSSPLPGHDTDVVTEVVWDSTFEGTSVAFIGTTAQAPFRVYALAQPTRVVVDVVDHPGN